MYLLKYSAGQWNTLVNFGSALSRLGGQFSVGGNITEYKKHLQGVRVSEALCAVFPATILQACIVHLIRNSLDYASWKDSKALAAAIKLIYTAASAEVALAELEAFESGSWVRSSIP